MAASSTWKIVALPLFRNKWFYKKVVQKLHHNYDYEGFYARW